MDKDAARILLINLRERIEKVEPNKYRLDGIITQRELDALDALLDIDGTAVTEESNTGKAHHQFQDGMSQPTGRIEVDLSILELPESDPSFRVCMDFGTAMSKACVVHDSEDGSDEEIHVLRLGVPGDQEEIDEEMLISSVLIDADGLLWFGQNAVKHAVDGISTRIDNIKRALSEGNLNATVDSTYNPTNCEISYRDVVLAYLMFFTWTINSALLNELGNASISRNFKRRFAMPCFPRSNARIVEGELKQLLGEAQVLSDTFGERIHLGLSLDAFLTAVKELRMEKRTYPFIDSSITEPLGVAGSLISWRSNCDNLALVVDIGAGTSDFSLYRLKITLNEDGSIDKTRTLAGEVDGTARGITEAGNHLDKLLKGYILKRAGINSSHQLFNNISHDLERDIRNLKESLFNSGSLYLALREGSAVEIFLAEFLALDEVKLFENSLRTTLVEILESADKDWMNWVQSNPSRYLTVVLTGGGASLPMAKNLAKGSITAHGKTIPVVSAVSFPEWLRSGYPELETLYPRIAVSLGGARRNTITSLAPLRTTGFGGASPQLEQYQTKGI